MRPGRGLDDVQQTAGKGGCLRGATAAGDWRKRSLDKLAHTLLSLTP